MEWGERLRHISRHRISYHDHNSDGFDTFGWRDRVGKFSSKFGRNLVHCWETISHWKGDNCGRSVHDGQADCPGLGVAKCTFRPRSVHGIRSNVPYHGGTDMLFSRWFPSCEISARGRIPVGVLVRMRVCTGDK